MCSRSRSRCWCWCWCLGNDGWQQSGQVPRLESWRQRRQRKRGFAGRSGAEISMMDASLRSIVHPPFEATERNLFGVAGWNYRAFDGFHRWNGMLLCLPGRGTLCDKAILTCCYPTSSLLCLHFYCTCRIVYKCMSLVPDKTTNQGQALQLEGSLFTSRKQLRSCPGIDDTVDSFLDVVPGMVCNDLGVYG